MEATVHQPSAPRDDALSGGADRNADPLAAAVLRSLGRSMSGQYSLGPARAGWLAALTFGFVPVFRLGQQFRDFVRFEKQQLTYLGDWVRLRGGDEAQAFADQVKPLGIRTIPSALSYLAALLVALIMLVMLQDRFGLDALLDATYRYRSLRPVERIYWEYTFAAWNVGLSCAYALHWLRTRLHARDVRRVAERFNAFAFREGAPQVPIPQPPSVLPAEVSWYVLAGILCWLGAWWSIPLVLAASAHRRYINETGHRFRIDLAERVRSMMLMQRPAVEVPTFVVHTRRCGNALCRAPLKSGAEFCVRCGSSVNAAVKSAVA